MTSDSAGPLATASAAGADTMVGTEKVTPVGNESTGAARGPNGHAPIADAKSARILNGGTKSRALVPLKKAETLEELEWKLAVLAGAGSCAVVQQKPNGAIKANGSAPHETLEELETTLELLTAPDPVVVKPNGKAHAESATAPTSGESLDKLSVAGTLAEIERQLTWDSSWWAAVRQIPAETPEELQRKLELLAGAGTLADIERRLSLSGLDADLADLARQIPNENAAELKSILTLLAGAGSAAEIRQKLAFDADLVRLILAVPAATPEELKHKIDLLAKAGSAALLELRLHLDADQLNLLDRIQASAPNELKRKLELLAAAGAVADIERKLTWNANPWVMVRGIPAQTPEELERKLELLAGAGTLADVERKLTADVDLAGLVRKIPAGTPAELNRKLELLAGAGTLADVERKLTADVDLAGLARKIPAGTSAERYRKLELLAGAGTLADIECKLSFDANLVNLVRQIPVSGPEALKRKLELLSSAGSVFDVERKLAFDTGVLDLINEIPASSPEELKRKLKLLVERKLEPLSQFEENLLKLLRQIPAKTYEEREKKIASLIPKAARATALAESKETASDYNSFLVHLARRIPASTPPQLEAKIHSLIPKRAARAEVAPPQPRPTNSNSGFRPDRRRGLLSSLRRVKNGLKMLTPNGAMAAYTAYNLRTRDGLGAPSPTTFLSSTSAFSLFEENLLKLLQQIPARNARALEDKITSLMPWRARGPAVERAARHSGDQGSYLVNLARQIAAKSPQELERKLSSLIPVERVRPSDGRGSVCIVARKPIGNVTRGPRVAKALVDAGYHVVVVGTGAPVDELRRMCPEVEYLVAAYWGFTHNVVDRIKERRLAWQRRQQRALTREEALLSKGGTDAFMLRLRRALTAAGLRRALARFAWEAFVIMPSAFILKKDSLSFKQARHDLRELDRFEIAIKYVWTLNQWTSSHAFGINADKLVADRHFDVVHVWDNYGLVGGAMVARSARAKLIYDAVEIFTERLGKDFNILEKIREHLERRQELGIFRKAEGMTGTGDALAGWYVKTFKIPKPLVLRNCRYYWPYRPDGRLRSDIGASPDTRVMLWCGSAYPQQGIEVAIRALQHLPKHIHLVVVTDFWPVWKKYVDEVLPSLAESVGVTDRFHILPARGPNDLIPYISDGDIGFVLSVPVDHPNQYYNLPNKFFEYIMGRMPVGTLAFPEVVDIVTKYEIGRVLDEHDSEKNAAIIQEMFEPETYARLKSNVMKAAQELCWENESRPYTDRVDSLMPPEQKERASAVRSNRQSMQGAVYELIETN